LITRGTPSFDESGFKMNSVVKLNKIATIKSYYVAGLLGSADEALQAEVDKALDACLKFKAGSLNDTDYPSTFFMTVF
jgi:hypothetical protein